MAKVRSGRLGPDPSGVRRGLARGGAYPAPTTGRLRSARARSGGRIALGVTAMSGTDGEETDLDDAVRRGDPQALGSAFSSYRERLRRTVEFRLDARLRGRVSTSDVLQDSYIEALKRLHHYRADPAVPLFIWPAVGDDAAAHRRASPAPDGPGPRRRPRGPAPTRRGRGQFGKDGRADGRFHLAEPGARPRRGDPPGPATPSTGSPPPTAKSSPSATSRSSVTARSPPCWRSSPTAASKRYVRAIERLRSLLESEGGPEESPR